MVKLFHTRNNFEKWLRNEIRKYSEMPKKRGRKVIKYGIAHSFGPERGLYYLPAVKKLSIEDPIQGKTFVEFTGEPAKLYADLMDYIDNNCELVYLDKEVNYAINNPLYQ